MNLVCSERPLLDFSLVGFACFAVAIVRGVAVLESLDTGSVPRFPTTITKCDAGIAGSVTLHGRTL